MKLFSLLPWWAYLATALAFAFLAVLYACLGFPAWIILYNVVGALLIGCLSLAQWDAEKECEAATRRASRAAGTISALPRRPVAPSGSARKG